MFSFHMIMFTVYFYDYRYTLSGQLIHLKRRPCLFIHAVTLLVEIMCRSHEAPRKKTLKKCASDP